MTNQSASISSPCYWNQIYTCRIIACFLCLLFSTEPSTRAETRPLLPSLNTSQFSRTQESTAEQAIEPGRPVERELAGGQSHAYTLTLAPGQFAYLLVEQKGIDVLVKLLGPDGKQVAEVNRNEMDGPEPLVAIADAGGVYRLEISSTDKNGKPGRYEAQLVELRFATQRDRNRVAGRKAFDEGGELHNKATRESVTAAIKKYEEALSLYREADDRSEQATLLLDMSNAYGFLTDYQNMLLYLEQARLVFQALADRNGEALTFNRIHILYRLIGELDKALQAAQQSLTLYQATGNKSKEALMLGNLGNTYNFMGEVDKARECYEQAMQLSRALGDKYREATMLHNIGYAYLIQTEYQKALEYFVQAVPLWQAIGNKQSESEEHSFIANEYARQGARQKALEHAAQAMQLLQAKGDFNAATVLTNVGHAYNKLGDFEKAIGYYNEALRIWRDTGNKRGEAITLKHIASAERDQGKLAEAQADIEKAIALVEFMRDRVSRPESRAAFVASLFSYYEFYIDLMMRMHAGNPKAGHDQAALAFSEKINARNLVELLTQARVDIRQGVDLQLLERERSLRERVTARLDSLTKVLNGKYTDAEKAAAKRESDALADEYRQVQDEIRRSSPRYVALTQPQPLTVREIQEQVLDQDTLLLKYSLGGEHSYLWAVTTESVRSYQLPRKAKIEAQARRVYELLTARQPAPELTEAQQRAREREADAQYRTQAMALSRMLLGPVAEQLGTRRLLIVADGALQYLPFAALPAPGSVEAVGSPASFVPLIVEHEIVSLPSASVLAVLRREMVVRRPAPKTVAVLADPVFDIDDARVKLSLSARQTEAVTRNDVTRATSASAATPLERALRSVRGDNMRSGLRRLLFSRDEAEAILSASPQASGLKALDFQATRELATSEELGRYRVVHFSTHGLLDSRYPELSGLVLSLVDKAGRPVDGFLRLHEIYNLQLNADLVVLSACQTGLGKEIRGEGLIGLTRGFMYAGAPRVMASLWQVDDAATADLMKRFYRGMMKEKLPAAAALRAAQLEMLKKPQWQSPYYWGAFVLQGEWR